MCVTVNPTHTHSAECFMVDGCCLSRWMSITYSSPPVSVLVFVSVCVCVRVCVHAFFFSIPVCTGSKHNLCMFSERRPQMDERQFIYMCFSRPPIFSAARCPLTRQTQQTVVLLSLAFSKMLHFLSIVPVRKFWKTTARWKKRRKRRR